MPGYGDSPPAEMVATAQGRVAFLDRVFQELGMRRPVLISPSMSGRFALPFLLAQGDRLAGFVPIAPVGTKDYAAEQYRRVQVGWVVGLLGSPWVLASLVGQLAGGWHGGWPCSGVSEGDLCLSQLMAGAGTCLPSALQPSR